MSKALLWILFGGLAYCQYPSLAPTDDGSLLYFPSDFRLKTEAELNLPPTAAIYRITQGRVERFTDPPPFNPYFPRFHGSPRVGGDGRVASYTITYSCVGGSSCFLTHPTTYSSYVFVDGKQFDVLPGKTQISRNGRYVLNFGRWSGVTIRGDYHQLRNLQTGKTIDVPVWPSNEAQAVTSDGRVLGFELPSGLSVKLWGPDGLRSIPTAGQPRSAILNDAGTTVVYETVISDREGNSSTDLRAIDLRSGRDTLLAHRNGIGFQASISNDGALALYLAEAQSGGPLQVWVVLTDGTGRALLTNVPEGITEAVLAGFGKAAFAFTGSGRLIRIDTSNAVVDEWIARTPNYYFASGYLVPGSLLVLRGSGLADSTRFAPVPAPRELDSVTVRLDGTPLPLLSISPQEIWLQIPFELEPSDKPLKLDVANSSPFEQRSSSSPVFRRHPYFFNDYGELKVAHSDFRSLVSRNSPAQPGEIVHAYATGLGRVTSPVETGRPTPLDRLFPLADPLDCVAGGPQNAQPLEVTFAGLAPGMTGIYQVDIRMPDSLPPYLFLNCGTPGEPSERFGGSIVTLAR